MIHEAKNGFIYELRYWENRFKEKQLRVFMDVLESVLRGIIRTDSVNNLRSYLPKKHLVDSCSVLMDGTEHTVTIRNRYDDIQPFGGWGTLYVDGENTGRTARVLTDYTVDYIENSGRCIMQETLTGRYFVNLEKLKNELGAYPGVNSVEAYICYGENNKLVLTAEIAAENGIETDKLKAYAAAKFNVYAQPVRLLVNGETLI